MRAFIRRAALLVTLLPFVAVPGRVGATSLTLDEFDGPAGGQTVSLSSGSQRAYGASSGTGAIGDVREIFIGASEVLAGSSFVQVSMNASATPGLLDISRSPGFRSGTTIQYEAGGTGLDLDLTGLTSFTLEGVSFDQNTALTVRTEAPSAGGECCVGSGATVFLPAGFSGDVVFYRSDSAFLGDLAHVFRVELQVVLETAGGHLQAERLVANLPEPSTGLLVALGLTSLAGWRRRSV
jgi:hypothetical protein